MQESKDWKEFINQILIDSRQFETPKTEFKGETEIQIFKSTDKNSLTEIRARYLQENLLIYLQIFNPKIPGYNKYVGSEYFQNNSFNWREKRTKVGLDFNETNTKGIYNMLKRGLIGIETQFVLNGKILKSIVDTHDEPQFISTYDFTNKSFFQKLFSKKVEKIEGVQKRVIKLNEIFSGI
jgi:hypothetical protein